MSPTGRLSSSFPREDYEPAPREARLIDNAFSVYADRKLGMPALLGMLAVAFYLELWLNHLPDSSNPLVLVIRMAGIPAVWMVTTYLLLLIGFFFTQANEFRLWNHGISAASGGEWVQDDVSNLFGWRSVLYWSKGERGIKYQWFNYICPDESKG
jgi:hypothetical protein